MKTAYTLWFTGRHGAGKSTIANELARKLEENKVPFVLLDGDELRKSVSSDLGYSLTERNEHMKRVAHISKYISDHGVVVIASVASPTEQSRATAKKILSKMLLVYVKCSLEECARRDVKGHYKKAKEKDENFKHFVADNFEEPKDFDVILDTQRESVEKSVEKLIEKLKEKKIIQ